MKKILATIFFAAQSIAATAGISSGKVTTLIVNSENYLFFTAGTKSGSPACGNNNQWAINLGTPKGKSIYVMLLAAQMQDKVVTIYGKQTCNEWGDREDVLYGSVE
jgi:hypothetical protein